MSDIPADALAAYQRAETILGQVSPACGLSWQLLAAIGQHASNHGRTLNHPPAHDAAHAVAQGSAHGVGPAAVHGGVHGVDGRLLVDTDAGRLDHDPGADRPVGPMALTPATWSVVAVDANDDGIRDPRNIHDAALAVAVLLCSNNHRLSDPVQLRRALQLLNTNPAFAAAVIATRDRYIADNPRPPIGPEIVVIRAAPAPEHAAPDAAADRATRSARTRPTAVASTTAAEGRLSPSPTPAPTPTDPDHPAGPDDPGEPGCSSTTSTAPQPSAPTTPSPEIP